MSLSRSKNRWMTLYFSIFSLILLMNITSSCIIPMPLEQDQTEQNYPPSHESFQVNPTPSQIIEYNPEVSNGQPLQFSIGPLSDPNEEDSLFWRVFLNYQGRYYNAIHRSNRGSGISPALRTKGIQFQLTPCLDFKLFNFEAPYRVELIVSDRPFREVEEDNAFINQILPEDAQNFRVHWFVRYTKALCPL